MQGNPGGGGGLNQIPPIGSAILKVLGVFLASRDHTVKSRGVSTCLPLKSGCGEVI